MSNEAYDVFPQSWHLPLGRPFGTLDALPEPPSSGRPFGMLLSSRCVEPLALDPSRFGYDSRTQTGTVRDGDSTVPLARHTDGHTNTVTEGGDGQNTNKDSDADHRED